MSNRKEEEVWVVEVYHEPIVGDKKSAVYIPMIVAATEQVAYDKWVVSKYAKYPKRITMFLRNDNV